MRFVAAILAGVSLAACATSTVPVPETGAFGLKYVEIDGDFFLKVEKVGADQATTLSKSSHYNRQDWKRRDWERYANTLFPQDEINFDALRDLRGSNLVPVGLVSPKPSAVPPCEETKDPDYAKVQKRVIRHAPKNQPYDQMTMVTTCELHKGLSPSQYSGIHERPNPYRFPTRYETVVDLDRNKKPEQRNVRIRNVSKAEIVQFIREETDMPRRMQEDLADTLDRM